MGALIRRSLGAISASRPFFLRRAILLCLNEVGDLTHPLRSLPRFIVHRRQFRSIGSSFLQFRLQEPTRPRSGAASSVFTGWIRILLAGLLASLIFRNKWYRRRSNVASSSETIDKHRVK